MLDRPARRKDSGAVKLLLVVSVVVELVALVPRAFESGALNLRWDTNSYGSIV